MWHLKILISICMYFPGPTIFGVEVNNFNGSEPATSLLYPKEYWGSAAASGLIFGLYCGPGVDLNLFGSDGNYRYF
jgi:hypothetical protein